MIFHRWPAPPGPQHPHECPRVIPAPSKGSTRRPRLHALGNAVLPQVGALASILLAFFEFDSQFEDAS